MALWLGTVTLAMISPCSHHPRGVRVVAQASRPCVAGDWGGGNNLRRRSSVADDLGHGLEYRSWEALNDDLGHGARIGEGL